MKGDVYEQRYSRYGCRATSAITSCERGANITATGHGSSADPLVCGAFVASGARASAPLYAERPPTHGVTPARREPASLERKAACAVPYTDPVHGSPSRPEEEGFAELVGLGCTKRKA
jgi:hypothetical protein